MEITIREILKNYIPSNEIKQRLNNKQIKLNNQIVTDLNTMMDILPDWRMDLGDFIFNNADRLKHITYFGNIRDWFGDYDTNVTKFKFLGAYDLLEFSKKDGIVFLREPNKNLMVKSFTEEEEKELETIFGNSDVLGFPDDLFYYIDELMNC